MRGSVVRATNRAFMPATPMETSWSWNGQARAYPPIQETDLEAFDFDAFEQARDTVGLDGASVER
jgi:hypothetical protein